MSYFPIILLGHPASVSLVSGRIASGPRFNSDIVAVNNACLAGFGMSRRTVDPIPEEWQSLPLAESAIRRIRDEVQKHSAAHPYWGLNDSAVSVLLPLYKQVFKDEGINPLYAICAIKPPSFAMSSTGQSQVHPIGSWLFHTLTALHDTKGENRQVSLGKKVVEDPETSLDEPADPEPDKDLEDFATLSPLLAKTHALCVKAAKDYKALQAGAFDQEIDDLYEEFARLTRIIRSPIPPEAPMIFVWREGDQTKQSDNMFSPSGTWQTLSVEIQAPPNTPLQVAPYHLPCEMWVRKAIWRVNGSESPAELTPGPNGRLEVIEGTQRLTVFGPAALILQTPPMPGAVTFEMEFCMQAGEGVLENMVSMLSERLAELSATQQ